MVRSIGRRVPSCWPSAVASAAVPLGRCWTRGYRLPAGCVIHTVGPIYRTGGLGEAELLRSCYTESLRLADLHQVETIAFPCISTGVYGYPKVEACHIAMETVLHWLENHNSPRQVTFCCFQAEDADLYRRRLADLFSPA